MKNRHYAFKWGGQGEKVRIRIVRTNCSKSSQSVNSRIIFNFLYHEKTNTEAQLELVNHKLSLDLQLKFFPGKSLLRTQTLTTLVKNQCKIGLILE